MILGAHSSPRISGHSVLAVIMGGGEGRRLFPLTKERAKPAVPLAGKYRLVDIPISNCINSNLRQIYVLTQFNSASLHRHIHQSYKFDPFTRGFVEILAAEQRISSTSWYQGTADAVRQNLHHFALDNYEYVVILSGDQLYRMDFRKVLAQHLETYADITIAAIPVPRDRATSLGILQINQEKRIVRFAEKPKDEKLLDELKLTDPIFSTLGITSSGDHYLASMGIYVFNRDVLRKVLDNEKTDFGKHIIPDSISRYRVFAHIFQGYWEDIGTIRNFYEANLAITDVVPQFNFFDGDAPIYTHPRFLPASKINRSEIIRAIVADGCIIDDSRIEHSIIGVRSRIESGCDIRDTVLMGCDFFESAHRRMQNEAMGIPHIGIGKNCRIKGAIIDKNARIGDNVTISNEGKLADMDGSNFFVRDGIVLIPKGAILPSGTTI
jgi:glucose-1-phosphate adenylyltransferase